MTNYTKTSVGKLSDLIKLENGKAFLHNALNLSSCEISLNCVPKNFKMPFSHKHKQNEEIYIFLKGNGIFSVDNNKIEIKEGDCIKVSPSVARTLESNGNENLQFICIQAKENSLEQFGLADAELC